MPWAKLLATNRPSADDSRAARHIQQPWAKAEDSESPMKVMNKTGVSSFRISANSNQVRCIAQSFRKRKGKQYHGQNQWDECNQNQIDTLVAQMHKYCGDHQDLGECRTHKKQRFEPFVNRRVTKSQRQQA